MRNSFTTGFFACAALTASSVAFAGTPYDLIRPTWPLTWDEKVFDNYDVSVTKNKDVLPKKLTPEAFEPNEFIPDTLDQAYLDAINYKVSPIRVNQAGYLESDAERQFYYVASEDDYEEDEEGLVTPIATFEIVDAEGKSLKPAVKGTFASSGQQIQSDMKVVAGTNASTYDQMRYQLNIKGQSGLVFIGKIPQGVPTSTRLRVKVGKNISSTFIVSDDVYSMVRDAGLKFFGVNRSGNSESWIHGPSHLKDGAGPIVTDAEDVRGGYNEALAGTLQGGWYDCGDYLKESQTQMYALMVTSLLAAANPDKDDDHYAYNHNETENVDGIPDILREAKHGADFVLRSFVRAKGVIDDMALSVGNFGSDHGGWGLPEYLDFMPVDNSATATDRGGPAARTVRLGEIGSNIGGETVAALALLSKTFAPYDKPFADSCLMVAEKMYDFAKNLQLGEDSYDGGKTYVNNTKAAGWSSPAYNGNNEAYD
ncbi:MAG: glycoside hydrolase family 9 protein, partial [Fibrobacter sp.]|nr:glycoside hydrolase family 9 protein [Fibrobacter sp.]